MVVVLPGSVWFGLLIRDHVRAKGLAASSRWIVISLGRLRDWPPAVLGADILLFANQQVHDARLVGRVVKVIADAVASGRIPETRIDEAHARVRALFGGTPG